MTIEQKPELNRFVDPSITLGWQYRWGQMKLLLPVLFFSWLLLVETALLKAWLVNKLHWDILAMLVGSGAAILLFVCAALEIQIRIRQRSKRVIQIEEKRIIVKPAKNQMVPWKRVRKFQFEPVPDTPGFRVDETEAASERPAESEVIRTCILGDGAGEDVNAGVVGVPPEEKDRRPDRF